MATYRYLLCDLLTDQPLAVLPLHGVKFDRRISRVGAFGASMSAPTQQLVDVAKTLYSYAGRSALWVYRDNALWWGGIPWTVIPKQGPRGAVEVSVQAATFDSYAHRRQLRADKVYVGWDQGSIIPDLWRTIQADPRGDIKMLTEDKHTGVDRDRTYLASEQAYVGQLIEQLGDVIDGPEHTVDVYTDGTGSRVKRLRVGQHLGLTTPRAVFQRAAKGGGRVLEWERIADAVDGGTTFQTRGATMDGNVGEAQEPLLSDRVENTALLDAGWPLLDMAADHSDVQYKYTLDGLAQGLMAEHSGALPRSGYTVTVGNTGWNPNRVGDVVRIKLDDMWHTRTDTVVRPVGCEVTPPEGDSPETVKLLLGDDD